MIVALAGNQNCGKTTLFNRLTGARQHVGNWPGVTVDKAEGSLVPKWQQGFSEPVSIVDLPGVYSLSPFSEDEEITGCFLTQTPPDVILNVVDASHLERNLYLTLQLMELGIPMVVALTMLDRLALAGGSVDVKALCRRLGVPVVPVCAKDGQGLAQLLPMLSAAKAPQPFQLGGEVGASLQRLRALGGEQSPAALRSMAAGSVAAPLRYPVQAIYRQLEATTGLPPDIAVAAQRHRTVAELVCGLYTPGGSASQSTPADRLLVQSRFALPLFCAIMALVFWMAFGLPGTALTRWLGGLLEVAGAGVACRLQAFGVHPWLRGLLVDGLLAGLGSVAGFLPPLLILMLLMDLLEDSGYLTRAAFLLDRPLRRVGLSGRSLLPLAMGFGCSVPAILCARGIKSTRERRLAILLAPLMSCSARMPVYGALAQAFFPGRAGLAVLWLYLIGMATAAGLGWLANRRCPTEAVFLLELPPLCMPSLSNALRQTLRRSREFLGRILSLVALATTAIWLLSHLTPRFAPTDALEQSLLGLLAGAVAPLLAPCGFGTKAAAAALATGLLAKESILSTLVVLAGSAHGLESLFTSPLAAFCFLLFTLLYTPCAATMATLRRELNAPKLANAAAGGYVLLAWLAAAGVYQLGSLFG